MTMKSIKKIQSDGTALRREQDNIERHFKLLAGDMAIHGEYNP